MASFYMVILETKVALLLGNDAAEGQVNAVDGQVGAIAYTWVVFAPGQGQKSTESKTN